MTTPQKIRCTYWFDSSSSDNRYETLEYENGTTSCNCPGWARRCVNGVRTCKHTRSVQAGLGRQHAANFKEFNVTDPQLRTVLPPRGQSAPQKQDKNAKPAKLGQRKMILN